ncbi:MAG: hypothetical protein IKH27_07250 [Oscillospiraceae bacterium]|nr:hypothetical protein [Oscillospiraceae bacterium]
MIGGTVTVGAINDWDYNSLMNNYFNKWFDTKSNYDFEGQGIDIKDTFVTTESELGDDRKLKSCEITANFTEPISVEGLKEIRFNQNRIILNEN